MVTESNPSHRSPLQDPGVKAQLEHLFGGSLFGPWPELGTSGATSFAPEPRRSRSKQWWLRLALLLSSALVVWAGYALFRPGLQRTADVQRANLAEELRVFVNDGNLERASEFLDLVRGYPNPQRRVSEPKAVKDTHSGQPLTADDSHLELIVVAEATLYRYFDADPARLQLIRPFLETAASPTPLRQLASLTILSREERSTRIPELERLREQLPNRTEPAYLLATAFEARDDSVRARTAWARSEELGPAWLGHRFEQAWFEWRHTERAAAQKLATQIVRSEPESIWARLAISTFQLEKSSIAASEAGTLSDAAAPRLTPVQIHFRALVEAMDAAKRDEQHRAKEQLSVAMASVHNELPFLLDAFDWLLTQRLSSLALAVTELGGWPSDSPVAAGKLRRLSELVDKAAQAESSTPPHPTIPKPSTPKHKRRPAKKK